MVLRRSTHFPRPLATGCRVRASFCHTTPLLSRWHESANSCSYRPLRRWSSEFLEMWVSAIGNPADNPAAPHRRRCENTAPLSASHVNPSPRPLMRAHRALLFDSALKSKTFNVTIAPRVRNLAGDEGRSARTRSIYFSMARTPLALPSETFQPQVRCGGATQGFSMSAGNGLDTQQEAV